MKLPKGWLTHQDIVAKLPKPSFQACQHLHVQLRDARKNARKETDYMRLPGKGQHFAYSPEWAKRFVANLMKHGRRGRPSDWTDCHKYVADRLGAHREGKTTITIREAMEEFRARHPDKKIVINKATVKSARMALHRARKAARTSAAP